MGVSKITGTDNKTYMRGFLNLYGDTYIGQRDKSSYMKYSPETGLVVKGSITSLSNIVTENDDGTTKTQTIQDALDELSKTANENLNEWVTALQEDLGIL
jgi:hypothetical protein